MDKHKNGKPKKQLKEQEYWIDDTSDDIKNAKARKK